MKRFIYLVQSKGKLGENLQDLESEDSDLVVLTWKTAVRNGIFFPFSTWTEGRNRLYEEVRNKDYLYYIFLDGDVILEKSSYIKENKNPWRLFEQYFLEYEPAVGFPHFDKYLQEPSYIYKEELKVESVYLFDACVMGVHREALNILLPYFNIDDSKHWCASQFYLCSLSSLLYKNHNLKFNQLIAHNLEHFAYPKTGDFSTKACFNLASAINKNKGKNKFLNIRGYMLFGNVEKKNTFYNYSQDELSKIFNYNSDLFKNRDEIIKNMGMSYGVSSFAEFINKKLGQNITNIIFFLPILFFSFSRPIYKKIDSFFGKIGEKYPNLRKVKQLLIGK